MIEIEIERDEDMVRVRGAVRAASAEAGFEKLDLTRALTIASELTRNVLRHASRGQLRIEVLSRGEQRGLQMAVEDRGPGIGDLALAFVDGFSTAGGLGLGLGGARRISSTFEVSSVPGEGTMVEATLWRAT